jgi:hypothetical protein
MLSTDACLLVSHIDSSSSSVMASPDGFRGEELFDGNPHPDLVVTLPAWTGSWTPSTQRRRFEYSLPETKSDTASGLRCRLGFTTVSGLSPGKWALQVQSFTPAVQTFSPRNLPFLFLNKCCGVGVNQRFALFSNRRQSLYRDKKFGQCIPWRLVVGGVSCASTYNEPNPPGRHSFSG